MPEYGTFATLMTMNLASIDSAAWLYIIPSARKSEKAAAIDEYNYPVQRFALQNFDYLGLSFRKEIREKLSTEGFPCSEMDEEIYYEVRLDKFNMYDT